MQEEQQPQQPQQPQQDAAPVIGGEPKTGGKSNVGLIIGIVVLLIVVGVVGAVIAINAGNQKVEDEEVATQEDPKIAERDKQREKDLKKIMAAVTDYQSNNVGKTPFNKDGSIDKKFIERYIDTGCSTSDGLKYTGCEKEFLDPRGKDYGFESPIYVDTEKIERSYSDELIHPFVNAKCGEKAGEIEMGSGERDVAIMIMLEGDGVSACKDNH